MTIKICWGLAIVIVFVSQISCAVAERAPDRPEDAKVIVWGTVEEVLESDDKEYTRFEVRLKVENNERGYVGKPGKVISAHCFQRKSSIIPIPGLGGHSAVPRKGQLVRCLLKGRKGEELEGIYPDWFHPLKLNDDQIAAMKWVQTVAGGCRLECDDKKPGRPVTKIYLFKMWDSGVTDADMKHVASFPDLRTLDLYYSRVRAPGFKVLAQLKHLEELNMGHISGVITDREIEALSESKSLRQLNLMNAAITDESMMLFAKMPSLRSLNLIGTNVTDKGLLFLKDHQHLEDISLNGADITNRGVRHLGEMTSLKHIRLYAVGITNSSLEVIGSLDLTSLDLRGCGVTEAGLFHIAKHKNLEELNLHDTRATDDVMKKLAELKNLRELTIQGTPVTDQGFLHLTACKKLKKIWINGTKITPDGVLAFQQALPECMVAQLWIE